MGRCSNLLANEGGSRGSAMARSFGRCDAARSSRKKGSEAFSSTIAGTGASGVACVGFELGFGKRSAEIA